MTFKDLCKVPSGTPMHLLDGRVGQMSIWHMMQASVSVRVPGEGVLRRLKCDAVRLRPDGSCEQVAPPAADATTGRLHVRR